MGAGSTVDQSGPEWRAVALNGSAPGLCGVTGLLVRQASKPEYSWLLDPQRGLEHPIDNRTLNRLAEEQMVQLLGEGDNPPVAPKDVAFYASRAFLETYKQVCSTGFQWGGLQQHSLRSAEVQLVIGPSSELQAMRLLAAEQFLHDMDKTIPGKIVADAFDDLALCWSEIEQWGRCGALCVGSAGHSGIYWAFHQRIAAALMLMPEGGERLRATFDLQVQPHFPRISYERYAEDARVLCAKWHTQAKSQRERQGIKGTGSNVTIRYDQRPKVVDVKDSTLSEDTKPVRPEEVLASRIMFYTGTEILNSSSVRH